MKQNRSVDICLLTATRTISTGELDACALSGFGQIKHENTDIDTLTNFVTAVDAQPRLQCNMALEMDAALIAARVQITGDYS